MRILLSLTLLLAACNGDEATPAKPFFERGLVMPTRSLKCQAAGQAPQDDCHYHGSTIAEMSDGTIAIAFYHGTAEKAPDAKIYWSRWDADAERFNAPAVLFDDPDYAEGNPALWSAEDGELFLFFVSIYGDGWPDAKPRLIRSSDQGKTWSAPQLLRDEPCWMTRNRPLRLENGELLLPVYQECLAYPVFMRSNDNFKTWQQERHESGQFVLEHAGQIQPALITMDDGSLLAITRDGLATQRIKKMVSSDLGKTWTASTPLELPNPGAAVDLARLKSGKVVVIFNNDTQERFPLSAALADETLESIEAIANVDDDCQDQACRRIDYPSVLQARDGTIWVSYSRGKAIGYARFNEAWLAGGKEKAGLE